MLSRKQVHETYLCFPFSSYYVFHKASLTDLPEWGEESGMFQVTHISSYPCILATLQLDDMNDNKRCVSIAPGFKKKKKMSETTVEYS